MPRAQCFCFYDQARQCVWSSDGVDDDEIDAYVSELPDRLFADAGGETDYLRGALKSGRTLLTLPVYLDEGSAPAVLVAGFSRNAGKSSWFNPSTLYQVLAPAVELIAETLRLYQEIEISGQVAAETLNELELVYKIDEEIHGSSSSNAGLVQLVGQSGRYLNVCYSVLLIPAKRIRISATHSSWKSVKRKVLDRYLIKQLLPKVQSQRAPMVFEMSGDEMDGDTAGQRYQTLVCPLIDSSGNAQGVLAQLGRVNQQPFSKNHRRFMTNIVRRVEYVVERSFDAATGLMNRAGFEAQLQESWKALAGTKDNHQLIYLDLDNLQLVNDTFGRNAGDAVIMRFARLLEEDLPRSAVVSRLTGDDFCLLLTHADDATAMQQARIIRKRSEALRYLQGDKSLQVTLSIGIASFGSSKGAETRGLTSARLACESAKDHGRDRIEVYNLENESLIQRHDDMQLVADIQQALDGDGFELLAQPISSLHAKNSRQRFEILLRMRGQDGVDVPTSALFSAAERYRMMPQIDRWVASNAIAMLNRYCDEVTRHDALFSINLSGQSLGDDDILKFLEAEIAASLVTTRSIGFEITESAAVSNLVKAQQFIDCLHQYGCRISLDDFGAGLSSFAYLKNFSVDTLKIDGSFIRDICENQISESMVAAITQVAKVMNLDTVAEYVEDENTRTLIRDLGVNYAQGHLVGIPRPLVEVLEELGQPIESTG